MAYEVFLHGGPWHGRRVAIEDGRDHIHILEALQEAIDRAIQAAPPADQIFATVPVREGTYSQIRNVSGQVVPGEFEWDGWVTHD